MEQCADGDDFRVVRDALQLSEPDGEEPGSDGMVEEHRLGIVPGIVQGASDERRVDHRNAGQDPGLSARERRRGCRRRGRLTTLDEV